MKPTNGLNHIGRTAQQAVGSVSLARDLVGGGRGYEAGGGEAGAGRRGPEGRVERVDELGVAARTSCTRIIRIML